MKQADLCCPPWSLQLPALLPVALKSAATDAGAALGGGKKTIGTIMPLKISAISQCVVSREENL